MSCKNRTLELIGIVGAIGLCRQLRRGAGAECANLSCASRACSLCGRFGARRNEQMDGAQERFAGRRACRGGVAAKRFAVGDGRFRGKTHSLDGKRVRHLKA
jgi:hypothetical protein